MVLTCNNCGSSELESDAARGDTVCTKCGSVLEDNLIVSEIQFEEGGHGASHIVGQMVGNDTGFKGLSYGGILGAGKESRQVTLENAKKKIRQVGANLRLNNHCIETAFNFYKMALCKRLTHGRKNSHVIAACIYITCRVEGTSHMLLDLSDVTQVNVYELGRTYLKLSSSLMLSIPAIDPCIYIVRFANRLNFEEKTHDVEMTALRLVQRMKRDWMHTGRRPSGLCGAALLVAARLNDIHCTIKDVIKVVKVCEATIRKRLNEFGDTPTSKLTLEEFMTVDLEDEEDPPCYKEARKKSKLPIDNEEDMDAIKAQLDKYKQEIEEDLQKHRKKLRGPWSKYAQETTASGDTYGESQLATKFINEETMETVREIVKDDYEIEREAFQAQLKALRPTAASLGLTESFGLEGEIEDSEMETDYESVMDDEEQTGEEEDEEGVQNDAGLLDLTDINDDEIDSYLLSPAEIHAKTSMWLKIHEEYLKEVEEKQKRKAEEEAERCKKEADGELQPKKKRRSRKRQPIQANSAGEAIEKMLQEKRISNKINYDVLKKLSSTFPTTNGSSNSGSTSQINNPAIRRLPSMLNLTS